MKIDDLRKLVQKGFSHTADDQRRIHDYMRSIGIDPANFYHELEMSSRYVNTHRDVSYSGTAVNLHSHNYVEIIYCHTSGGAEYLVGAERYKLQSGDIFIVPAGVSHRPLLPEAMLQPYERDVLWVSQEFADDICSRFPEEMHYDWRHSIPIRTAGTRWEFLGQLFRNGVLEEEERRPGWETAVIGNTLTIFANIRRVCMEQGTDSVKAEQPELMDRIAAYIERNYPEPISVESLARQFFVSSSTVGHLFRQKMGVSVYHYITQRRLIAAKTLIHAGKPMEEVGREVGFLDYSTFYRAFKKEFGISPRQFRKLQSGQEENG